jgi:hypothetical protein
MNIIGENSLNSTGVGLAHVDYDANTGEIAERSD